MNTTTRKADQIAADSDLPEGWAIAMLGEVSDARLGKTPRRTDYRDEGTHRIIKFRDLTVAGIDYSVSKAGYVVQSPIALNGLRPVFLGDVLITASAHSGDQIGKKCAFVDRLPRVAGDTYFVGELLGITSNHHVMRDKWPSYWFSSARGKEAIQEAVAGVHLTAGHAQRMPVPIAPLDEQDRIIKLLDDLFLQVNAARNRLGNVPLILKRFRQCVLAAACSGRLTEGWRSDDAPDGDLPVGWRWVPIDELLPKGGIFDGPFGSNLKTSDYTPSGERVIRMENIGWLSFIGSKLAFIREKKNQSLARHTVGAGDIIFSSFIDDEIRTCVLPVLPTKAIAKADCFCLRPDPHLVDRRYLALQLSSQESYDALRENIHGATRPRVNTTQVRRLSVRVCPISEQQEIVRRVEALFKLADTIEKRIEAATKRAEKLTQAILAKAFRGELVPTEAELARREGRDYEPASALIARIKAEHSMAGTLPGSRADSGPARGWRRRRFVMSATC